MRVTPSCDPLNNFYISQASNVQFSPNIAYGSGAYVAVWVDGRSSAYRIYGTRITPSGSVLDPSGIQIGATDNTYQYSPSIEYNGTNFLAVWGCLYAPQRINGRFINTDGSLSDTLKIADASGYVYKTSIAYSGSNYMVSWIEYSGTVYVVKGIILDNSGVPVGAPFTIASSVYYYSLSLCYDGAQYCVSYILQSGYQYWGQKHDLNGSPIGSPFRISPSNNNHFYGEIIPGANNCYLNVWSETIGSYYDIYGNLDIHIIGVEEENQICPEQDGYVATIISGPFHPPEGKTIRIFDVMGREVNMYQMAPGAYFVEIDGKLAQKVVKIK